MNVNKLKARKRLLVQRFRRLIRTVIMNLSWLEDTGDQKFSMNVKRNIEMIVRVSRNIGFLTLKEKSLIRTPHKVRGVEDRKVLVRLLLSLDCFAKVPPKARARLVPTVNFLIVPDGHVIIREGHPAEFVYYILTGEVLCSHQEYDQAKDKFVEKYISVCIPGDCIGDIEIIEEKPRMCSYVANSEVELLVVQKEAYDKILMPTEQKRWNDLKNAVLSLESLSFFNEFQIICACKIGVIHQYDALQKIYSEDKGNLGFSYFVLSGECTIMQNLKIKVSENGDQKDFELVSIHEDNNEQAGDIDKMKMLRLIKEKGQKMSQIDNVSDLSLSSHEKDAEKASHKSVPADARRAFAKCRQYAQKAVQKISSSKSIHTSSIDDIHYENTLYDQFTSDTIPTSPRGSTATIKSHHPISDNDTTIYKRGDDKKESSFSYFQDEMNEDLLSKFTSRERFSSSDIYTIENHFIEVGTIGPGGVFGIGEELKQRIVCASNTLQCLVLPRFWLFEPEQNPRNIWQNRRFNLETIIPSRAKLFQFFMKTRKWKKFKDTYIQSILDKSTLNHCAKIQDIPVMSRLLEGSDV